MSKITDAIRSCIGAITGLAGYTIVKEETIAEMEAELKSLEKERIGLEHEIERTRNLTARKFFKQYEYVIMVDRKNVYPKIWNDGRFEEGVRTVTFLSVPGSVPELTIKK